MRAPARTPCYIAAHHFTTLGSPGVETRSRYNEPLSGYLIAKCQEYLPRM